MFPEARPLGKFCGPTRNDAHAGTFASNTRTTILTQMAMVAMTSKRNGRKNEKWSSEVTERSDALDLEDKVFQGTPKQIAKSLKRSAERSERRKSSPFRSAMSMLTFYINRAGRNLSASRRKKLETAKDELRAAFGRDG